MEKIVKSEYKEDTYEYDKIILLNNKEYNIYGKNNLNSINQNFIKNMESKDITSVYVTLDNSNRENLYNYYDKVNLIETASIIILKYLENVSHDCLGLNLINNTTEGNNNEIKNDFIFGINHTRDMGNMKQILYNNIKIECVYYLNTLDEKQRTITGRGTYKESITFFVEVNDKVILKKAIDTLKDLINEILSNNYVSNMGDTKSFILGKNRWGKNDISIKHKTFEKLCYSSLIKDSVTNRIERFFNEKDDYERFGKNYKLTFILEGIPGTGKTSFVQAIANKYDLSIFYISHNNQIDDNIIINSISDIDNKYFIVFIEDFDKMFVEVDETTTETFGKNTSVSFSAFTNIFDGSFSKQGMICFITTNDISKINNILKRSGRTDAIYKFDYCDEEQVLNFIDHCFNNTEEEKRNKIKKDFWKKIRNLKFTVSSLSQYFFENKHNIDGLIENCDKFKEMINQSEYGSSNNSRTMHI